MDLRLAQISIPLMDATRGAPQNPTSPCDEPGPARPRRGVPRTRPRMIKESMTPLAHAPARLEGGSSPVDRPARAPMPFDTPALLAQRSTLTHLREGPRGVRQRQAIVQLQETRASSTGVVQRVLGDGDLAGPPKRLDGSANRVYEVDYGPSAHGELGAAKGYFKPLTDINTASGIGIYDAEQAANTLATSRLAEQLDLPVVARERTAAHHADEHDWEGTVSAHVPNAEPMRANNQTRVINLRDPATQKGLSDLQLFDALVGQSDRRGENILVGADGTVTGIDEEATFGFGVDFRRNKKAGHREGLEDPDEGRGMNKYLGLPSQVDHGTAEKVLGLDPDNLPPALAGDGAYRLPESSMALLGERLRRVQAHLTRLQGDGQLVNDWNDDTYLAASQEPLFSSKHGGAGVPRSYLARHLAERRAEGHADGGAAPATAPRRLDGPAALTNVLGQGVDNPDGQPIPQVIHRFWSGKAMSDAARENLLESAQATKGTRFTQKLWHSDAVERQMQERGMITAEETESRRVQRETLRAAGYELQAVESLAVEREITNPRMHKYLGREAEYAPRVPGTLTRAEIEVMATKAVDSIQQGGEFRYDELKHLSDMARLMYLHKEGGHHFDVDMGLGDMDLDRRYRHTDPAGQVPLLGSLTNISNDGINVNLNRLRPSPERDLAASEDDVRAVATKASEMSTMLNGMIATRPGTANMADAIDFLRTDAVHAGTDMIPSGMSANRNLIYGQDRGSSLSQADQETRRKYTVPPYLLDLQHITADSDNR